MALFRDPKDPLADILQDLHPYLARGIFARDLPAPVVQEEVRPRGREVGDPVRLVGSGPPARGKGVFSGRGLRALFRVKSNDRRPAEVWRLLFVFNRNLFGKWPRAQHRRPRRLVSRWTQTATRGRWLVEGLRGVLWV